MYKVMIVDDETWIRKGLKAQIEWERLLLVPDSEASDGLEALQIAQDRMPDILITDVRMPEMSGLMLAESMLAGNPGLKVLIVSGYSDFEYAKAALQLEAVSYILKPIDPVELNEMLGKAVDKLNAEAVEKRLAQHLTGSLEKHTADLCHGTAGSATAASFLDALQLRGMHGKCIASVLFHYDDAQYDASTMSALLEQTLLSLPSGSKQCFIWERGYSRLAAAVLANDRWRLHDFVRNTLMGLQRSNISGVWATVGNPAALNEPLGFRRSYQEALAMSERYGLQRKETLITYTQEEEEPIQHSYPFQLQRKLHEAILRLDKSGSAATVREIEDYYRLTEGATLKHARRFLLSVVSDTVRNLLAEQTAFHGGLIDRGFDFCLNIDTYEDLGRMMGWLSRYLEEVAAAMASANQRDVHRSVLAAADYIREHYAEELSLNSVSTRYFVTSNYFSTVFKEVIGENFLEFLTRIRMEEAKALLTASELKIGQIGEKVGYADSRYFSKLFKKHTGRMPTEFRQLRPDDGDGR
ncbi:response regulator [Paenibacillus sp. GCM10023248]|uniref:response regulator transcription factor n=1 Tax=unclassified Paenibacillus TaxID=185978 RepID=UPI00237956C2|nr:response regulator [Paenibacillus sp. MAHUQ-63]MDD9269439.1 response regulator [Paenibacillus sp. MAHUQ-63]